MRAMVLAVSGLASPHVNFFSPAAQFSPHPRPQPFAWVWREVPLAALGVGERQCISSIRRQALDGMPGGWTDGVTPCRPPGGWIPRGAQRTPRRDMQCDADPGQREMLNLGSVFVAIQSRTAGAGTAAIGPPPHLGVHCTTDTSLQRQDDKTGRLDPALYSILSFHPRNDLVRDHFLSFSVRFPGRESSFWRTVNLISAAGPSWFSRYRLLSSC